MVCSSVVDHVMNVYDNNSIFFLKVSDIGHRLLIDAYSPKTNTINHLMQTESNMILEIPTVWLLVTSSY